MEKPQEIKKEIKPVKVEQKTPAPGNADVEKQTAVREVS